MVSHWASSTKWQDCQCSRHRARPESTCLSLRKSLTHPLTLKEGVFRELFRELDTQLNSVMETRHVLVANKDNVTMVTKMREKLQTNVSEPSTPCKMLHDEILPKSEQQSWKSSFIGLEYPTLTREEGLSILWA